MLCRYARSWAAHQANDRKDHRALRHTFGTRWLQAGGDIYKLSKILRHSGVAVTEAHYAHLLKEDLVAASQQVKIPVARRPGGNVVRMRPKRDAGSN